MVSTNVTGTLASLPACHFLPHFIWQDQTKRFPSRDMIKKASVLLNVVPYWSWESTQSCHICKREFRNHLPTGNHVAVGQHCNFITWDNTFYSLHWFLSLTSDTGALLWSCLTCLHIVLRSSILSHGLFSFSFLIFIMGNHTVRGPFYQLPPKKLTWQITFHKEVAHETVSFVVSRNVRS